MRNATIKAVVAAVLLWTVVIDRSAAASREVWLISTHRVCGGCSGPLESQPVQIWRLGDDRQWIAADLSSLFQTDDPTVPTVVFVHGYDGGPDDAVRMGVRMAWPLYRELCSDACGRPFRLVVWTWPAERKIDGFRDRTIRGLLADARSKASRTDTESILMGQFIDRIEPQVPLTLVGYSFGARVVGGALQLLGGGQISGCDLSRQNTAPRVPIRAMLVAAAMDADWLAPGHRDAEALSQVDRMLITVNGNDRFLKRYPLLYRGHGPQALGCVGPACLGYLGSEQAKLDLQDVTGAVGRAHDWDSYVACSGVLEKLGSYTFRQPQAGAASSDATGTPAATKTRSPQNRKSLVAN